MNEKLAKWKQEKATKLSQHTSGLSKGSSESTTLQRTTPRVINHTTTSVQSSSKPIPTKPSVSSRRAISSTKPTVTAPILTKTGLHTTKKKSIISGSTSCTRKPNSHLGSPPRHHSASRPQETIDHHHSQTPSIPAVVANPPTMPTKLQTELAYSKYLQVQYLHHSLKRAAVKERACAEGDILRAWQQVHNAEDHLSRLQSQELCYVRKIEIYDTLHQLDVALTQSRGALMQVEEPLDAVIAVEEALNNIVILDSNRFCRVEEERKASNTDTADRDHDNLPDVFRTILDSLEAAQEVLCDQQNDEAKISSQLTHLHAWQQPFEETVSNIKRHIDPELTALDRDISQLWVQLIANKFKSESGAGDSVNTSTITMSHLVVKKTAADNSAIHTAQNNSTSPPLTKDMSCHDKGQSAVSPARTTVGTPPSTERRLNFHSKGDGSTKQKDKKSMMSQSRTTVSPLQMKTFVKNL